MLVQGLQVELIGPPVRIGQRRFMPFVVGNVQYRALTSVAMFCSFLFSVSVLSVFGFRTLHGGRAGERTSRRVHVG